MGQDADHEAAMILYNNSGKGVRAVPKGLLAFR